MGDHLHPEKMIALVRLLPLKGAAAERQMRTTLRKALFRAPHPSLSSLPAQMDRHHRLAHRGLHLHIHPCPFRPREPLGLTVTTMVAA